MGAPAGGSYDFTFKLFDASAGGAQIGADIVLKDVPVTNGIFTVTLDFGEAAFAGGGRRFLEIAVRAGAGTGAFTVLSPRQEITNPPFSIRSLSASSANFRNFKPPKP